MALLLDKCLDADRLILPLGQIAGRRDRNLQHAPLLQELALLDRERTSGHLASPSWPLSRERGGTVAMVHDSVNPRGSARFQID
jgi:hypothetical protein